MSITQRYYPIRTLFNNVSKLFEHICGKEAIHYNISNGLYPKIEVAKYNIDGIAEIRHRYLENNKKVSQITISEPYCQFLWTLCYAMVVIIDEYILRPRQNIVPPLDEKRVDIACEVFNTGMKVFDKNSLISYADFYILPNACDKKIKDVSTTNHIYTHALCYVLFHKYAHFELKHLDTIQETADDEYSADAYAFCNMCYDSSSKQDEMAKYLGCIIGLGSLFFVDNTLKGDQAHPDIDDRMNRLINYMRDQNIDNIELCYHCVIAIYKFWALYYELEYPNISNMNTICIEKYYEIYQNFYKTFKLHHQ